MNSNFYPKQHSPNDLSNIKHNVFFRKYEITLYKTLIDFSFGRPWTTELLAGPLMWRTFLNPSPVGVRLVDNVALIQVFIREFIFPFSVSFLQCSTFISSTCCSYQQDKGAKPRDLPKNNDLSERGEHWVHNT
jgi:hypothetical protein